MLTREKIAELERIQRQFNEGPWKRHMKLCRFADERATALRHTCPGKIYIAVQGDSDPRPAGVVINRDDMWPGYGRVLNNEFGSDYTFYVQSRVIGHNYLGGSE